MSATLSLLKKRSQGTAVKQVALKLKSDLLYTKEGLSRQKEEIAGTSGTLDSLLEAAIKKADDQKAFALEQTDPDLQISAMDEWGRLQNEVGKLRKKTKLKGPVAVLQLEIEMDHIDLRVANIDTLLPLIDARIAELPA